MSEIDWNKFDRAVSVHIKFYDKDERCIGFHRVARPQQKTVADAYEYTNGEWKHSEYTFLYWYEPIGFVYRSSDCAPYEYQFICTREQFEAYAKEQEAKQEGEKWTHGIPPDGIYCKVNHDGEFVNCYLIGRDDMGAFVYRIDGDYYSTMCESNLKPIKPKLTKAEAWDKYTKEGLNPDWISVKYDII